VPSRSPRWSAPSRSSSTSRDVTGPSAPGDEIPEVSGINAADPSGPDAAEAADAATADTTTEATAAPSNAAEAGAPVAGTEDEAAPPRRRHPFYLRGRRLRLPRSRRGLFALLLVLSALGGIATFSAVTLLNWTETADFCGRCHTMAPELAAYEAGPHRDVACAECHVEPGVAGWIKAKLNGTRQLVEVVLGTFPEPIPPPDHSLLPSASDTCQKCHAVEAHPVTKLTASTLYAEDKENTRQFVGLLIRPAGGNPFDVTKSVHWHVLRNVSYWSPDANGARIDLVDETAEDGHIKQYISQARITDSANVDPDIDAIKATQTQTTMTCYDCHNRVGHPIPNPRAGLDQAMSTDVIDPTLPYIKREGMRILWANYTDEQAADAAADELADFYKLNYPEVAETKADEIDAAIGEIKTLYRLSATPEMKVTAKTYPDNLGHLDFPGCFRCHDGGHFLVVDGVATKQTIPATCDTCHTFPQLGPAVASLPLGEPPSSHADNLWVFNHKNVAESLDPGGTSCGECHARDYCVNCHSTGAVTVDHDEMATNHAKVIREQGNTACAYCHQPVYCARCHDEPVLPITTPFSEGPETSPVPDLPSSVSWPLTPRT
jgi:nitrate/TMAO reductase-like tetraheme cytochrome c subunit